MGAMIIIRGGLRRKRVSWAASRFCSTQNAHQEDATTITIDRSGLCSPPAHTHEEPPQESAMSKYIKSLVRFRGGPITVAEYMEEVLTNPTAGFYMNRDVFGTHGDFITSPDISQMFGELVGIWSMCLWQQMGQPKELNLVELGPGRGTLMADLLRGVSKFSEYADAIAVHLVECSPALRRLQQQALGVILEGDMKDLNGTGNPPKEESLNTPKKMASCFFKSKFSWHIDLEQVPRGVPTIILAHEFYDALPIHQFQKTPCGWREKLIDVAEGVEQGLRFVLSPEPTPASKMYLAKRFKWAMLEEKVELDQVEVCPQALKITQEIGKRVGKDGGGALVIDYGEDKLISDSLQAIQKHKFVPVLQDPGKADLSAYVDFAALRHVIKEIAVGASAFGPISQSQFLGMLGINFRLEALLQNATEKQAEALKTGYWRLVGEGTAPWWEGEEKLAPIGLGSRYKVLSIINDTLGAPICFQ